MGVITFWHNTLSALRNPAANTVEEATCNFDGVSLLALSAQVAGTLNSADQTNTSGHGVAVIVDITAISGTLPTLTITIQGKDPVSGKYYPLLTSAALSAVATTVLTIFPGIAATANVAASACLPRSWRVRADVAGTGVSCTATIAAAIME